MAHKIETYTSRSRIAVVNEEKAKETLRLKQIELNLLKEEIIKEFVETGKKGGIKDRILNIFRNKK
jgi:hypothetical protein